MANQDPTTTGTTDTNGLTEAERAKGIILVRLTKKFANRIFHEFHPDHPHEVDKGGELLVTGDRVVKAAPTTGVRGAILQGVLEEVRDPGALPSPEPPDVLDVVNGQIQPAGGAPAAATDAGATDASSKASSK